MRMTRVRVQLMRCQWQSGGCHSGGGEASRSVRIVRRISHENRILSDRIMGVEIFIPPIMIGAGDPDGAPRGGSMTDISKNTPRRAPVGL